MILAAWLLAAATETVPAEQTEGEKQPRWCKNAQTLLAKDDADNTADDAAWEQLTQEIDSPELRAALRAAAVDGEDAQDPYRHRHQALQMATRYACGEPSAESAEEARTKALALAASDPRIHGIRQGNGVIDLWKERLRKTLVEFFQSEGLQSYAGDVRILYFIVLAGVFLWALVRVWKKSRSARHFHGPSQEEAQQAKEERERAQAFSFWQQKARAACAQGDVRAAYVFGQQALRVRLGDIAQDAVAPARTSREVLSALTPSLQAAAQPALLSFDRGFFGAGASMADAQLFLQQVDAAEALVRGTGSREKSP